VFGFLIRLEIVVNLMCGKLKPSGLESRAKLKTLGGFALVIVMLVGLTGCGTLRQGNASISPCEKLGRELAGAKTAQQRAETLEAGVELKCWERKSL
jgi:hypothetical protein